MFETYLLYYFVKKTTISIENQPKGQLVKIKNPF
jgi:hypothetical protein